jgi:hypothetical protein
MSVKIYKYESKSEQKFAAQSSVSDSFLAFDMTREEIIEWWGQRAKERAIEEMTDNIDRFGKRYTFISDDMSDFRTDLKRHFEIGNCKDEAFNAELRKFLDQLPPPVKKKK